MDALNCSCAVLEPIDFLVYIILELQLFLGLLHSFTSNFALGFPNILIHTFNPIGVITIPDILVVKVQISFWFLNFLIPLISL